MTIPFDKPWLSYASQLTVLRNRGLTVPDPAAAEEFLKHVNYYRFSGYCLAFEHAGRHTFASGTTFDHVRGAYDFDFRLRDLLSEALEVVEVDARTAVAHHFGQKYTPFGHTEPANFHAAPPVRPVFRPPAVPPFRHEIWQERLEREVERSHELFVTAYQKKYSGYPKLPIWMATEVMSFGSLSMMYQGMKKADQKEIAARYGVQPDTLMSWAHHLSVVRNLCAHHARLWDRVWAVSPAIPPGNAWLPPHLPNNRRLGVTLLILRRLLGRCPGSARFAADWKGRVDHLLGNLPPAPEAAAKLGISPGWFVGPIWA